MPVTSLGELAVLDEAARLLTEAESLPEIKEVRDKAEAVRTYAQAAKLGLELQNRAAEVKLRAERKAGQFLAALKLRGGNRRAKAQRAPLRLEDLGVSRDQSTRWQRIASVAEQDFCHYLQAARELGREVTVAGLLRMAGQDRQAPCAARREVVVLRPRPDGPREPVSRDRLAYEELVSELVSHCQLLADVLRPFCEEGPYEFRRAERRAVAGLLREIGELLQEFKGACSCTNGGSGL